MVESQSEKDNLVERVHAVAAQPSWIANEGTHVVPGPQQQR